MQQTPMLSSMPLVSTKQLRVSGGGGVVVKRADTRRNNVEDKERSSKEHRSPASAKAATEEGWK